MPRQGSWYEQPKLFMQEIEAARRGEAMRLKERKVKEEEATVLKFIRLLRGQ